MDICGFPSSVESSNCDPYPETNKNHTDPLSYKTIALTSCLYKVLESMINTRFIWCLDKSGMLDRSQCDFRTHRSTMDHLVSLEMPLHGNSRQLVSSLIFKRLRRQPRNTVSYATCTGLGSEADCLFRVRISQASPNSSQNRDHTL